MAKRPKEVSFIVGIYYETDKEPHNYCTIKVMSPDDDDVYKVTLCRAVDKFCEMYPSRRITGVSPIGNDWEA